MIGASSGLNVHRLRAALDSERFVADCAAALDGPQNGRRPPVSSTTEAGALGAQIDAQPLHDLSDALSEVAEIEQWWEIGPL